MVSKASVVTISEDKRLRWLLRLRGVLIPVARSPVDLEEDTGDADRKIGVVALARVRPIGSVGDMRLVVGRVDVFAIPAAREVHLRADAGGAHLLRESRMLGSLALEVEAEEIDCLCGRASIVATFAGIPADHAEIRRECLGCPRLVRKEIVNNGTAVDARKTSVCPLEVQVGEPVVGFVFLDRDGGTLTLLEEIGGGLETEVAAPDDRVDVPRDSAWIDDRV